MTGLNQELDRESDKLTDSILQMPAYDTLFLPSSRSTLSSVGGKCSRSCSTKFSRSQCQASSVKTNL